MTDRQIIQRIQELKKAKNAVILAHNYELGEIQDVADFCGDSLELSIRAAETSADLIVFCGVRFMAETAKILSPGKKVLLPVERAGCDMADMVDGASLRRKKAEMNRPITVCYVNTTAETKAECDISVTSSNALAIISRLPKDRPVLFVPDRNLGDYCMKETGCAMTMWDGCCPVHQRLTPEMIRKRRAEYPDAEVLIHPEAPAETLALADYALSTGGILKHVKNSDKKEFIIATEIGIFHRLEKENPDKKMIMLSCEAVCPHMKLIRLQDLLDCMEQEKTVIELDETLRSKAEKPIRRMLDMNFDWL